MICNWAILCPGPSLKKATNVVFDEGGLICVNAAISFNTAQLRPNIWALMDPELFLSSSKKIDLNALSGFTVLWVPTNFDHHASNPHVTGWAGWTKETKQLFNKFDVVPFDDSLESMMPFGGNIPWRIFTTFTALAFAVINGAKKIRMYGCDLKGNKYFTLGWRNFRTNLSAERWQLEQHWFNEIVRVCANNGVEVTRESY